MFEIDRNLAYHFNFNLCWLFLLGLLSFNQKNLFIYNFSHKADFMSFASMSRSLVNAKKINKSFSLEIISDPILNFVLKTLKFLLFGLINRFNLIVAVI